MEFLQLIKILHIASVSNVVQTSGLTVLELFDFEYNFFFHAFGIFLFVDIIRNENNFRWYIFLFNGSFWNIIEINFGFSKFQAFPNLFLFIDIQFFHKFGLKNAQTGQ